ncbi:MAG: cytochrome c family protein [Erythrobacter sp.]|jgi:cytochrome c|nr:cytochrome c family protein [Erythrobacter sp.]
MRHITTTLITLGSVFALAACGGQQSAEEPATEPAQTAEAPAESAPEAAPEATAEQVAFADFTGDAAAGEKVFVKCKTCHVLEEGENRVGPHLYGVVGREAGSVEGFNYSTANKESGITWSKDVLFEYLEAPQTYLKGTRMAFPGIKDPQERADLIEYLAANGQV